MVSPSSLDFGTEATEMTLQVRKNLTATPMAPFRVTPTEPWITVSPQTGQSAGPNDPVSIAVTIDRSLLSAGESAGTVRVSSEGASEQRIRVVARRRLTAEFRADELQPFQGDRVTFQDLSRVAGGLEGITDWLWEFGDGSTSTEQNPSHVYAITGSYDVTLTTMSGDVTATQTKQDYITVREKIAPSAGFSALATTVPALSALGFVDQSAHGTAPITQWQWNFGDGTIATGSAPTHVYAAPGVYTVRLRVTSAHGQDEAVKQNYITVEPVPPRVDFTCSDVQPVLGQEVTFTDLSEPGHAAMASWYWEFGDGNTSELRNPTHTYRAVGSFTVSLTVTDVEGNKSTETKAGFISAQGFPPQASFEVDRPWGVSELDAFAFTSTSDEGTGETATYRWEFGDGTDSTEKNPTHTYAAAGAYTVTLHVSNAFGTDSAQLVGLPVHEATALDRYVRKDDGTPLNIEEEQSEAFSGGQWKVLRFASQEWRDETTVTPHVWEHWLALAIPDVIQNDTALLFVSGGRTTQSPPNRIDELTDFAVQSGSVVALLRMVPNQPTVFQEEGVERVEDEIIAYTFDKYLESAALGDPDEEWPALLPMAKSAVRAMDVVQQYTAQQNSPVQDFVVTGASKRGWTTWLAAATDHRVVGIAPMVIDMLNLGAQMDWHYSALCGYAEALQDYVDMDVIARLHTPEGQALEAIVDPYAYASRFTIPMFGLNGTADEFFVPDSAQFYYDELAHYGPMYLRYFPNGNHYLHEGYDATVRGMLPFYNAVVHNQTLPTLDWDIVDTPDEATLEVQLDTVPLSATLWTGTVGEISGARDFRLHIVGDAVWQPTPLSAADPGGTYYTATIPAPPDGWTGYFMEFEFASGTPGEPHIFTTEVRCTPSITPCYSPGGYGTIETAGTGTDQITVVRLGGTRYEMGYWYGYLLAEQIAPCWTGMKAVFPATEADYNAAIAAMWNSNHFDTEAWEQELRGMADGCADAGYPQITFRELQKMHLLPDISEYGCGLFAAWGEATVNGDLYHMRNLDWTMNAGVQDYPVVAIYEPNDGEKHAVVGFAGMAGAAVGGLNVHGISVSQIMGGFGDPETLNGIPFPVLLRDALYHDTTLAEALDRIAAATRTNEYHYGISGRDPFGQLDARLLFTSNSRFDEFGGGDPVLPHPYYEPFYEPFDDVVYWKRHDGGAYAGDGPENHRKGNKTLHAAIDARYGQIDAARAIEIAIADGVASTLVSIIYNATTGHFWVAYAHGSDPAHNQGYVEIHLSP